MFWHILFLKNTGTTGSLLFHFFVLLVSGGHTRIIVMKNHYEMEMIGNTIDDAAGEAFDKCGKVMGFPYPAGPLIDKLAREGQSQGFFFCKTCNKRT